MAAIRAANGQTVTDEMIGSWCDALDRDEWPEGWVNVGGVVDGPPPVEAEGNVVLSVKIPAGVKRAIERRARDAGVSTSTAVRELLEDGLLSAKA